MFEKIMDATEKKKIVSIKWLLTTGNSNKAK